MAASDALRVVEEFVSEHYFTSDAASETFHKRVLDRRKAWDGSDEPTSRSRITSSRGELLALIAGLYPNATSGEADDNGHQVMIDDSLRPKAAELNQRLRQLLGFDSGEFHHETTGPVHRYAAHGVDEFPLAIVDAVPVPSLEDLLVKGAPTLLTAWEPDDEPGAKPITSVSQALSRLFVERDGTPPAEFALVFAGRWVVVTPAARWQQGRFLGVDLQTVLERNETKRGGELDTAICCIDSESLGPDETGAIWWSDTLDDSARHTVGVSEDLREGVRTSIEIIANEVVRRRRDLGLAPLPDDQAQPLAKQSLRFLYRILFLLYAEASPQLGILPVGAPEYEAGYSIDRLRDLVQVKLTSGRSRNGTHLYDSLAVLFRLIDQGHGYATRAVTDQTPVVAPTANDQSGPASHTSPDGRPGARRMLGDDSDQSADDATGEVPGLEFQSLRADLFAPGAISLIDQVGLGNQALQQVLARLLLTKEQRGRERGFISYVELGINQLGAVYEGLMSYTGFFASEELFEVARDGDPKKGSWVVPVDRAEDIEEKDFVRVEDPDTGEQVPRRYGTGEFVFRLSGRERQQSASYYTAEVLTQFTVGQALEELLDQDGTVTPADEILGLTICEPALGSGAFAIEAVRQLAEQYLIRKQRELDTKIDPEDHPAELQKVKASIALHQVYGLDLNATAVEFAEITLWLDTMAKGLQAPWFGLHLRRGNSLIGARRACYRRDQITDTSWLTTPATDIPLADIAERVRNDSTAQTKAAGLVPHWLLPAEGWGSTAASKEANTLAPDRVKALKAWRRQVKIKPTTSEVKRLVDLGYQVEELWTMAYRRLQVADQQTRRRIPLWGQEPDDSEAAYVTREQIEQSLADPDGAYQRLRRVMDAWCALWFWPLTEAEIKPPSLEEWISTCEEVLGIQSMKTRNAVNRRNQEQLAPANPWDALADQENFQLSAAGAAAHVSDVVEAHPWLQVCEKVAAQQGFFHWELDFAPIFGRGGFDLQLGNPPWVRPRGDVDALLAEGNPWWMLAHKPSEAERAEKRETTLRLPGMIDAVLEGTGDVVGLAGFVGDVTNYPVLAGLQPDLYRCFMAQVWAHQSMRGISSLVHPETHFTDEKAGLLRENTYLRLRRHWQFVNEVKLFEIDDKKIYSVNVYGVPQNTGFDQATALYQPATVVNSYRHNGDGEEPGFKFEGKWDTRPHRARIQRVTDETLEVWRDLLESSDTPPRRSRMVYTVNREVADVLARLSHADRIGSLGLYFSRGWDESIDRKKGYFVKEWGVLATWNDVILQGPHLHVANPAYKTPNPTMRSNEDWSPVDLEHLTPDAIPATAYKPAGDRTKYDHDYTHWTDDPSSPGSLDRDGIHWEDESARDHFRIAWRTMAANTGERTLIPAVLPPGSSHVDGLFSATSKHLAHVPIAAGTLSSLIADFAIRVSPKAHIRVAALERLPLPPLDHPLIPALILRTLRLNCLTNAYAPLWADCWDPAFQRDSWTQTDHVFTDLGDVTPEWSRSTPLRRDSDRRQALVEIDALVALMLDIPAEELCTVYRTQFAVLYGYDHGQGRGRYIFDANGRIIPNTVYAAWQKKGDAIAAEERTATNASGHTYIYKLPFETYDREADMTTAYHEFERRLARLREQGSRS